MATNKPKLGAKHVPGTARLQRQLRRLDAEAVRKEWEANAGKRAARALELLAEDAAKKARVAAEEQRARCESCDYRALERHAGWHCAAMPEMQVPCCKWELVYWQTPDGKASKAHPAKREELRA